MAGECKEKTGRIEALEGGRLTKHLKKSRPRCNYRSWTHCVSGQ